VRKTLVKRAETHLMASIVFSLVPRVSVLSKKGARSLHAHISSLASLLSVNGMDMFLYYLATDRSVLCVSEG
jgi:hypothetical protein